MNPWDQLKKHTLARIGLNRSGLSLSTREVLDFQRDHALARDAVLEEWDVSAFKEKLKESKFTSSIMNTNVSSREVFLKRPDLGRTLRKKSMNETQPKQVEICVCISDGLSPRAVDRHALLFLEALRELDFFSKHKVELILIPFGRVASADAAASFFQARLGVMLIGERPGLSSPDSMGLYMTFSPLVGKSDAERNCISNIRTPGGLEPALAAKQFFSLSQESLRLQLSGVSLKQNSRELL